MDHYAVMGNPIKHSKSPAIHSEFAAQTKSNLDYCALLVKHGEFAEAVKLFFENGGKGLNVTVPFKEDAWQLVNKHSEDAYLAGAVNTLFVDNEGGLVGHNTDGIGLVRDITENHKGKLAGKSILVLGAGGASRGILRPLLRECPGNIYIANRTVLKAEQLAEKFSPFGEVLGCGYSDLKNQTFDWVINATSASLQGELPPLSSQLLRSGAWCYDLMYSSAKTTFCQWANLAGAEKSIDGLGMLVEQAAESFYLWRGIRPNTQNVMHGLKADNIL